MYRGGSAVTADRLLQGVLDLNQIWAGPGSDPRFNANLEHYKRRRECRVVVVARIVTRHCIIARRDDLEYPANAGSLERAHRDAFLHPSAGDGLVDRVGAGGHW